MSKTIRKRTNTARMQKPNIHRKVRHRVKLMLEKNPESDELEGKEMLKRRVIEEDESE